MKGPRLLKIDVEQYGDACIDHGRKSTTGYAVCGGGSRGRHPIRILHRRLFWEFHGTLPEAVMHSCDNPRCINPKHLKGGTRDQNNKDRAAKGRSAKHRPDLRSLSAEAVTTIRARWARRQGKKDSENGVARLARDYQRDTQTIYRIVRGETYVN